MEQKEYELLLSFAMLVVWIVYAHLFYRSWRLQRRPRLLIGISFDKKRQPLIYLTNMSEKTIHIEKVGLIAKPHTATVEPEFVDLTDRKGQWENVCLEDAKIKGINDFSYQGPIKPGNVRIVHSVVSALEEARQRFGETPKEFEFRAIGLYTSEYSSFGCSRSFCKSNSDKTSFEYEPLSWDVSIKSLGKNNGSANWM